MTGEFVAMKRGGVESEVFFSSFLRTKKINRTVSRPEHF